MFFTRLLIEGLCSLASMRCVHWACVGPFAAVAVTFAPEEDDRFMCCSFGFAAFVQSGEPGCHSLFFSPGRKGVDEDRVGRGMDEWPSRKKMIILPLRVYGAVIYMPV
jgi:hypothetical protein